jgi:predicted transposase YdaD
LKEKGERKREKEVKREGRNEGRKKKVWKKEPKLSKKDEPRIATVSLSRTLSCIHYSAAQRWLRNDNNGD